MGKGSSGGGTDWNMVAYQNAYNAAMRGASLDAVMAAQPNYAQANQLAFQHAQPAGGGFEFPDMTPMLEMFANSMNNMNSGPSYEEMLKKQQIEEAKAERDDLYLKRVAAESDAVDYIDSTIAQERANANLIGTDYVMDEERRNKRISDYFAEIWGSDNETRLGELMGQYGTPKGFTEFTYQRGTAASDTKTPASEKTVSTSSTVKKGTALVPEDDETLGKANTTLG